MKSLSAEFEVLGSKVNDMMLGLGEKLAPAIKEDLIPALETLVLTTGMFVEAIGPGLVAAIGWATDAMVGFQVIVLDLVSLWDDEAGRKARQIVLNRELSKGLGSSIVTHQRLAAAMITLGQQNAWTEDGLKSLIATTGASGIQTGAAIKLVKEHAAAAGWDVKWIDMLDAATEDATLSSEEWSRALGTGGFELTMYQENLDETTGEYVSLEDQIEATIDMQAEFTDQLRALSDPLFGAVKGMQGLAKAEEVVAELEKEGKKGTEEWQLAMLDLAEQTFGAQAALDEMDETQLLAAMDAIGLATGQTREEVALMLQDLGILDGMDIAFAIRAQVTAGTQSAQSTNVAAHGRSFFRGEQMIVGEDGPEFITAATSGMVVSNPNTPGGNFNSFFGSSGGGGTSGGITIQEMNIAVQDDLRDPGAGRRFIERLVSDIESYNREQVR